MHLLSPLSPSPPPAFFNKGYDTLSCHPISPSRFLPLIHFSITQAMIPIPCHPLSPQLPFPSLSSSPLPPALHLFLTSPFSPSPLHYNTGNDTNSLEVINEHVTRCVTHNILNTRFSDINKKLETALVCKHILPPHAHTLVDTHSCTHP